MIDYLRDRGAKWKTLHSKALIAGGATPRSNIFTQSPRSMR
jgi:hypothetical protein